MPGPWVPRPPLSTARGGLDSVVDVDGRIYAIGGFGTGFDPIHKSVEVRDPITEQWTFGEPMSMPRGNPGAAYADGRIHVVGGAVGKMDNTNKGESFDLSTKKWTRIRNRPRGPILGPGAAAFDGRVYIIGGAERGLGPKGITNAVSIYDPATDKWSDVEPMPTARYLLRAVELDGQIYAVGGAVADGQPFSDALERYDPAADTWSKLHPMSVGRGNPGVAAVDGQIFAVGGAGGVLGSAAPRKTVEQYDPQTDVWAPSEDLPVARASLSAERGQGNTIVALGGFEPAASARVESRLA